MSELLTYTQNARLMSMKPFLVIGGIVLKQWYFDLLAAECPLSLGTDEFIDAVITALPDEQFVLYNAACSVLHEEDLDPEQLMELFDTLSLVPSIYEHYWRYFFGKLPKFEPEKEAAYVHMVFMGLSLVEDRRIPPQVVHDYLRKLIKNTADQPRKPYWNYVARLMIDEEINDLMIMQSAMVVSADFTHTTNEVMPGLDVPKFMMSIMSTRIEGLLSILRQTTTA